MDIDDKKMYGYANKIECEKICPICKSSKIKILDDYYWNRKYKCEGCGRIFEMVYDDVGCTDDGEDIVELIHVTVTEVSKKEASRNGNYI